MRPDLPIELRREALAGLAEAPVQQAKLLIQLARDTRFDPDRTAQAISGLLLELPPEAAFAISGELDALLKSDTPGLRSAAVATKVQSGAPLGALADQDPQALIDAIVSMIEKDKPIPASLPGTLIDLAAQGKIAGQAIPLAAELSGDKAELFERLAELAKPAMDLSYDQWGQEHAVAMAALAGMHETPDEDWPEGYGAYRIARAEASALKLGREKYFHEEKGCVKCHGEHGEGTPGFPPLAQSPMVNGDPVRAATIVKYGLMGELAHAINPADGKPYSAQMEPLSYYDYNEMAAALTFVRQSFGNFSAPVTVEDVAAAESPDEGMMWEASALLTSYPFERDRLTGPLPAPPPPAIDVNNWAPPSVGLWLMLVVVGLGMLLILGGTYAGKFLQDPSTPSHA